LQDAMSFTDGQTVLVPGRESLQDDSRDDTSSSDRPIDQPPGLKSGQYDSRDSS
jgi:hypothetical protein